MEFFELLRLRRVSATILLFQFKLMQTFEMPMKSLPNECRSVHALLLRRNVSCFQKLRVDYYLDGFHCGCLSTV